MLSFLSPCVLPLVPGYLSLMSGVSTSVVVEGEGEPGDIGRMFRSTVLFVAGFTVVFVLLGAAASTAGELMRAHQRVLSQTAGVLVIAMGVVVAGLVSPRLLQQERRFHVSPSKLGPFAPPVMGMAFAFGWTPCIGPVLAGVLAVAAERGTLTKGALLLMAYSLGLGVPFVIAGLGFARLQGVFGWFKRNARMVNGVSGALLIGFGVLLFLDKVSWLAIRMVDFMNRIGLS